MLPVLFFITHHRNKVVRTGLCLVMWWDCAGIAAQCSPTAPVVYQALIESVHIMRAVMPTPEEGLKQEINRRGEGSGWKVTWPQRSVRGGVGYLVQHCFGWLVVPPLREAPL